VSIFKVEGKAEEVRIKRTSSRTKLHSQRLQNLKSRASWIYYKTSMGLVYRTELTDQLLLAVMRILVLFGSRFSE
jgi:hypothetical protein